MGYAPGGGSSTLTVVDRPDLNRNNFDAIRFGLAALVIFSHSFPLLSGSNATEPLYRLTGGQASLGGVAVEGFFILSGFLVTHSWARSDGIRAFLLKRARRIYPAFAVLSILSLLLVVPVACRIPFGTLPDGPLWREAASLALLRGVEPPGAFPQNSIHAINGSLWSIPKEAGCYVGTAILGLAGALRRRACVPALLIAAILASLAFRIWNLSYGALWAHVLPYFLAGMCVYLYRDRIPITTRGAALALLAFVPATLVPHGWAVAAPLAGAYLLFWLGFNRTLGLHGWAKHGDFSYGMYLYAFPLQQLIVQEIGPTSPLALFALSLPASVAMGALSWHGVEKWFVRHRVKVPIVAGPVGYSGG